MTEPRPRDWAATARAWWPILRDVAAFVVGVWILLVKRDPSTSLQVIGFACLGVSTSRVGDWLIEKLSGPSRRGK